MKLKLKMQIHIKRIVNEENICIPIHSIKIDFIFAIKKILTRKYFILIYDMPEHGITVHQQITQICVQDHRWIKTGQMDNCTALTELPINQTLHCAPGSFSKSSQKINIDKSLLPSEMTQA